MDDFDAKNHIREMHRDAQTRALARMAQAYEAAHQTRQAPLARLSHRVTLFARKLVRKAVQPYGQTRPRSVSHPTF